VYHKAGSYLVNNYTRQFNGFGENDFEDGRPFEIIQKEVEELLTGKLVVTVNGHSDFGSLDLRMADFDVFECHNFWKKWTGGYSKQDGKKTYNPISLQRLYKHYFQESIQDRQHTATKDALATIRLFKEAYIPHMVNLNNYSNRYLNEEMQDDFGYIK